MQSGAPFEGPVSGVRVVQSSDKRIIFDPNFTDEKDAVISILVAGTLDAITMVEAGAKEASEADMLALLAYAHTLIKEMCHAQNDFMALCKATYGSTSVKEFYNNPDESLYEKVEQFLTEEKLEVLYGKGKKEFQSVLDTLDDETKDYLIQHNFVETLE